MASKLFTVTHAPPLTVAELIAALERFPPDTRVFVDGYEWGIENAYPPRPVTARHTGKDAYGGDYEAVTPLSADAARPDVSGVLISRYEPEGGTGGQGGGRPA